MLRSLLSLVLFMVAGSAAAADWLTAPSYYTHDSSTAQRVNQYAAIGPYYYFHRQDFIRSGYRHIRSSIQAGGSADNFHIVEEFGNPVRPYEEWRFPYKPYSAPYPAWGAPFAGVGGGGFGPWGGVGPGGFGGGNGGNVNGLPPGILPPGAGFIPQPYNDGHWPTYDQNDRTQYFRPYRN